MRSGRLAGTWGAVLASLAVAAPAWSQLAEPDGPVPTARYERPPPGVDPSILNRPPPEPAGPSAYVPPEAPNLNLPAPPVVRRRGSQAPDSLETTAAAPRERPWERPAVGTQAYSPPPVPQPAQVAHATRPEVRPARAAPVGRTVELQIGAFADRGNAERAARAARMAGPTRIQQTTVGGVTYHRVIVGPGSEAPMRGALGRLGFRDARPIRPS